MRCDADERVDARDLARSPAETVVGRGNRLSAQPVGNVVFVIHAMTLGGAERVMALMADYWAARGRRVTVVTIGAETAADYRMDPRVARVSLNLNCAARSPLVGLSNNLRRLLALRRTIAGISPDVVISFMVTDNILTLLATRFLGVPVIVAEHTIPVASPRNRIWRILRRATYPLADALVVLTRDAGQFFWPSMQRRIVVIPNPVRDLGLGADGSTVSTARSVLITVGRLEAVKQLDHVVRAFARVATEFPNWRLLLVGEGSLRASLEELAADLGVNDRVQCVGYSANPEIYMREAGLFVMASRHEGFPCALQEAMASGLPVLSYDCPGGIREILRNGLDGVLVPPNDVDRLTEAMASLIGNPARRAELGRAGLAVRERYSIDSIMSIWEREMARLDMGKPPSPSSARYLVRFDDICPTMNWSLWREIEDILVECDVKPILAVIPDNQDPKLHVDRPYQNFWQEVRKWQGMGWTIGLHGYQHAYVTNDAGCIGINKYSEFAGLPAGVQREKIRRGVAIFRDHGVIPDLWIAPAHSFDVHTLEALRAEGIDTVSDGFFTRPGFDRRNMFWIPQQIWNFAPRREGVWTVCMHHNAWTRSDLERFYRNIKKYRDNLTSVPEMRIDYSERKLSNIDRAYAKVYQTLLLTRNYVRKSNLLRISNALLLR